MKHIIRTIRRILRPHKAPCAESRANLTYELLRSQLWRSFYH